MKVAIVGAGFSGIGSRSAPAQRARRLHDLRARRRASAASGTTTPTRHRVRRPVVPVPVLVRAAQGLEARRARPATRSPRTCATSRPVRHQPAPPLGTKIPRPGTRTRGAWTLAAADERAPRRCAHPSAAASSTGRAARDRPARRLRPAPVPLRPVDHYHDLSGQARRVIGTGASAIQFVRRRRAGRAPRRLPAHPPVDAAAQEPDTAGMLTLLKLVPALHRIRRADLFLSMEIVIAGLDRCAPIRKVIEAGLTPFMERRSRPGAAREATPDYRSAASAAVLVPTTSRRCRGRTSTLIADRIEKIVREGVVTDDGTVRRGRHDRLGHRVQRRTTSSRRWPCTGGRRRAEQAWSRRRARRTSDHRRGLPEPVPHVRAEHQRRGRSIIYMSSRSRLTSPTRCECYATAAPARSRCAPTRRSSSTTGCRSSSRIWTNCNSWYRQAGSGKMTNSVARPHAGLPQGDQRGRPRRVLRTSPRRYSLPR